MGLPLHVRYGLKSSRNDLPDQTGKNARQEGLFLSIGMPAAVD